MKTYLTISEFAGLRNININSLRYYEKLGLLVPAYIDNETKYRYYLPEQLVNLDIIILAVRLGLPLKSLKSYIDSSGVMDNQKLLSDCENLLSEKISDMQTGLNIIKLTMHNIERNQKYDRIERIYEREIDERYLLIKPYNGNFNDISQKEKFCMDLFLYAQKHNFAPIFPVGIIVKFTDEEPSIAFFFQILKPDLKDSNVWHIPKKSFLCKRTEMTLHTNIFESIAESFTTKNQTFIIANMDTSKLHFNSRHSEIQMLK